MKKKLLTLLALSAVFATGLRAQSLVWAKNFGGLGQMNYGLSLALDANGNSYTTGYFAGTPDFDPGAGTYTVASAGSDDIYITKFDSSGNFAWVKTFGGTGIDHAVSIALDSKGNIYTTGTFQGTADFDPGAGTYTLTSAGGDDNFICKLDAAGNFKWAVRIGNANVDVAANIATDPSDNVLLTGTFRQIVDFDPGTGTNNLTSAAFNDCFLLKLDSTGAFVWVRQWGGLSDDGGGVVISDPAGNIYTTGTFGYIMDLDPTAGTYTVQASGPNDLFINKLDAAGNYIWGGYFGGSNSDAVGAITLDALGNIFMTGWFWGNADMDPTPATYTVATIQDQDIFVQKLNPNGGLVWVKVMGGTNIDEGLGIAVDGGGNVYTAGFFQGTADFDPGAGTVNYTPVWGSDIYISCLDVNGNYVSSKQIGGANGDGASCIKLDAHNQMYLTGNFGGVVDFDPDAGTYNLTSSGAYDAYVLKLGQTAGVGIKENAEALNNVSLFPNPTNGLVNVSFSEAVSKYGVKLMNSAGQVVMENKDLNMQHFTFDITQLAKGMYFLEVSMGDKTSRTKLVKAE